MDFGAPRTYLFICRLTRFALVEMAMTSATSNTSATKRKTTHRSAQVLFALLLICVVPNMSLGYSVLTHEAIIDSMWVHDITPVLLKRFPGATADELRHVRDTMRRMLKENGSPPEGRFADLALLEPVRDYKARHASTMLTFDAVVDAIGQIEAKRRAA